MIGTINGDGSVLFYLFGIFWYVGGEVGEREWMLGRVRYYGWFFDDWSFLVHCCVLDRHDHWC